MEKNKLNLFYNILESRTGIDFIKNKELRSMNFFGEKLNIPPRNIMLVILDLDNIFDTNSLKKIVVEDKFTSVNNILKIMD